MVLSPKTEELWRYIRNMFWVHQLSSPCKEHPGKPQFIFGKVGFTGVYIILLSFAQKKRL